MNIKGNVGTLTLMEIKENINRRYSLLAYLSTVFFPLRSLKGLGTDPFKNNAMNVLLVVHNVKVFLRFDVFVILTP